MIEMDRIRAEQRTRALAGLDVRGAQHLKATKASEVREIREGDELVMIRLDKGSVRFFAHLPDGREVVGASFEAVTAGVRQLLRDACVIDWAPVILVEPARLDREPMLSAEDAAEAIMSGVLPANVTAWAGLKLERFHLGCRTGRSGAPEWRALHWDMLGQDDPWMLARHSEEYLGPLPGQVKTTPTTYEGGIGRNHLPVAMSCVPFTEDRWNELQALADRLRWLQAHVMALFHVDGDRMLLTERLLSNQPLMAGTMLITGPVVDR